MNRITTNKDPLRFEDIWKIKHTRKDDHLYVPLSTPIQLFYTMAQLGKLHKQFAHPSAIKLFNLLKSAGTRAVTSKTLEKLEYLISTCEPCPKAKTVSKRYRVIIGAENARINAKVYIDFMYIEGALYYIWLMTQLTSEKLNLLSHLQPNLSERSYLHYGQLFTLDCQT